MQILFVLLANKILVWYNFEKGQDSPLESIKNAFVAKEPVLLATYVAC